MAEAPGTPEEEMENLSLDDDTQEVKEFRQRPRHQQQRLLRVYPRVLAESLLLYSSGEDCEQILKRQFELTPEMLSARYHGDNALSNSLRHEEAARAKFLVDLADRKNPEALQHRTDSLDNLPMLAAMLGDEASELMEKLLNSDPRQLHRQYDRSGRNVIHHCVLQESLMPLRLVLSTVGQQIRDGRVQRRQVRAAFHMNDIEGNTPMHLASAANRREILDLLHEFSDEHELDMNFDEKEHCGDRRTPLMLAVASGAKETARFLLVNDLADFDETDRHDRTASQLTEDEDFRKQLEVWSGGSEEPELEAGATAAAVPAAESETAKYTSVDSAGVDSGVATAPPLPERVNPSPMMGDVANPLTDAEVSEICERLQQTGKEADFVERLKQRWGRDVELMGMVSESERVKTGMSLLRGNPDNREPIRRILEEIDVTGILD